MAEVPRGNTPLRQLSRLAAEAAAEVASATASSASASRSSDSRGFTAEEFSRIYHAVEGAEDNQEATRRLLSKVFELEDEEDKDTGPAEVRDDSEWEDGGSPERRKIHLHALHATLLYLSVYETSHQHGSKVFHLPGESVYSAAIAMPQIARSSGWCLSFTSGGATVAVLTIMTLTLQYFMMVSLYRASVMYGDVNGQPNMCTYGTEYLTPEPPRGPFGVQYNPQMTNLETSYQTATKTNILWLLLRRLGEHELAGLVGPVDMGIQSRTCRLVCMGIFCVAVVSDFRHIWDTVQFLLHCPTTSRPLGASKNTGQDVWIKFRDASSGGGVQAEDVCREAQEALDNVVFQMNGIPWAWKAFWCWPLVCLQFMVIYFIGYLGSRLLLETGGILESILNAAALDFILEMDLIAYKAFVRAMTNDIMTRMRPYELAPDNLATKLNALRTQQYHYQKVHLLGRLVWQTQHMFLAITLVFLYYCVYLVCNCDMLIWPLTGTPAFPWNEHYYNDSFSWFGGYDYWMGRWVSKNITWKGETTCAPHRPDRFRVEGCGLPHDWPMR